MARKWNRGTPTNWEATDPYQMITDMMIKELEQGRIPWTKPWTGGSGMHKNAYTGHEYGLTNQLILRSAGYERPLWLGFDQAHKMGGHVKAGQHGVKIIKWDVKKVRISQEDEEDRFFIKFRPLTLTVFNVDQCEGLDIPDPDQIPAVTIEPHEMAEMIVDKMPMRPPVEYHGEQAYYQPSSDLVVLPLRERFKGQAEFYSTLFHELGHSTGHKSRLNRHSMQKDVQPLFWSSTYAKEELVAEMTAAFLCGKAGFLEDTGKNSVAYIQSWLQALRNDKKIFLQAAQLAQHACEFILGIQKDYK